MSTNRIATPLSRKATLVSVNITQWTARKLDKKVTDKVNREHSAVADAGRFNKLLIGAEHLAELQGMVSKARALHYLMTRPWADDGPRILPNALFAKFSDAFRTLKREFNEAADRFCAAYPAFIEERKRELNGMFDEADYPAVEEIRSKFNLDLTILPFPDAEDFRADLDDDTVEEIRQQVRTTTGNVLDNAMKHTITQVSETVGHMAKALAEYGDEIDGSKRTRSFKDTLVENIRTLADLLDAFNLTNDPKLAEITKRIKAELCVEDAQTLRDNEKVRANVQQSADEIVKAVSGIFG